MIHAAITSPQIRTTASSSRLLIGRSPLRYPSGNAVTTSLLSGASWPASSGASAGTPSLRPAARAEAEADHDEQSNRPPPIPRIMYTRHPLFGIAIRRCQDDHVTKEKTNGAITHHHVRDRTPASRSVPRLHGAKKTVQSLAIWCCTVRRSLPPEQTAVRSRFSMPSF
jgi:hypothetical protein